jgi:hypothetical protein
MKKTIDSIDKKTAAVFVLLFAGAYSFMIGFKNNRWYMYIIGILLFAAAYALRKGKFRKKKR